MENLVAGRCGSIGNEGLKDEKHQKRFEEWMTIPLDGF